MEVALGSGVLCVDDWLECEGIWLVQWDSGDCAQEVCAQKRTEHILPLPHNRKLEVGKYHVLVQDQRCVNQ